MSNPPDGHDEAYYRGILEELQRSIPDRPPPDDNFDARRVTDAELAERGLPPRPDALLAPREFAFWNRMFEPPLKFTRAAFDFAFPLPFPYRLNYPVVVGSGQYQSSANWSGGYVTPKKRRRVTMICGSWRVPHSSVPAGADPSITEFRGSTWIGLDGQRLYLHSSLPQIGTTQILELVNGQRVERAEAWWQWWVRGHRFPPVLLPKLAVMPGDEIFAMLIVLNKTDVMFVIANRTKNTILMPFVRTAPAATMPTGPTPVQLLVSGATAEWVMERPTEWNSDRLYPLPDYDTHRFDDCFTLSTGATPPRSVDLSGARFIDMYEVRENPHRTADISIGRWHSDESLTTTFR